MPKGTIVFNSLMIKGSDLRIWKGRENRYRHVDLISEPILEFRKSFNPKTVTFMISDQRTNPMTLIYNIRCRSCEFINL